MTQSYLIFRYEQNSASGKTEIWTVISKMGMTPLGLIRWYAAWRRYTFDPFPETKFDQKCLNEISEKLELLTMLHGKKKHE